MNAKRKGEAFSAGCAVCDEAVALIERAACSSCEVNPAELLLAALSACMIKGIERVTPILKFQLRGVEVRVHGMRQDVPPRIESIDYESLVDTDESEQRQALLHDNVKKYGTVYNTVAPCTDLACEIEHGTLTSPSAP